MTNYEKNKIVILKDEKKVFEFQLSESKNSAEGECDIFIKTAKRLCFENIICGNYFRHYTYPKFMIKLVSWHGFYQERRNKNIFTPVIHFKCKKNGNIEGPWHLGSINSFEPFAFPVCSIYTPINIDMTKTYKSELDKEKSYYLKMNGNENKRYDFFVLPSCLSIEKFEESPVYPLNILTDIELFNTEDGVAKPISFDKTKIINIKDIGKNHIIVREINDPNDMYNKINKSYSLILHDPNDIYKKLTNRPVKVGNNKLELLKTIHEKELGIEKGNEQKTVFHQLFRKRRKL